MSSYVSIAAPGLVLGDRPERRVSTSPSALDQRILAWWQALSTPTPSMSRFKKTQALIERAETTQMGSSDEFLSCTSVHALKRRLMLDGINDSTVAEVFAATRLAAKISLGLYPHIEQMFAGWTMLHGMFAEMHTGEGKTLTAAFPAIVMALTGTPVHIITVNEYLVRRDAETLAPLYKMFGLTVGVVSDSMNDSERRRAYTSDIVYCTNKQIVFDYLRDNQLLKSDRYGLKYKLRSLLNPNPAQPFVRGLGFAIVDEADSVLIDDARVPLILAESQETEKSVIAEAAVALSIAQTLSEDVDFNIQKDSRSAWLTDTGLEAVRKIADKLEGAWRFERYRAELVNQAVTALYVFKLDRDYLVRNSVVELIDASTGRIMPDRKLQHGLHRMLELKEKCSVSKDNEVIASLSFQRFFQRYCYLSGMSGTLTEVRSELQNVYRSGVAQIPTHKPGIRKLSAAKILFNRTDQLQSALEEVVTRHTTGQPLLIGTRTVELSEKFSNLLSESGIVHELLNARQDAAEAEIVAIGGQPYAVTVATNMAGRGTDISLRKRAAVLGGLHVINLEVNESNRIDRQLFGRSARQGDPGSCQSILSLTDELIVNMAPAPLLSAVREVMSKSPLVGQILARCLVRFSQYRVERFHNKQRLAVFYGQEQLNRQLAVSGDLE